MNDDIYADQSVVSGKMEDRMFSAPYTRDGIKMLERVYCNCIMAGVGPKEKLVQHIKDNPHLHPTLKNGLLVGMIHFGKIGELDPQSQEMVKKQLNMRSLSFDNL